MNEFLNKYNIIFGLFVISILCGCKNRGSNIGREEDGYSIDDERKECIEEGRIFENENYIGHFRDKDKETDASDNIKYGAQIGDVSIKHNEYCYGKKGMYICIDFDTHEQEDNIFKVYAFFYKKDNSTPLRDMEDKPIYCQKTPLLRVAMAFIRKYRIIDTLVCLCHIAI